MATKIDQIVDYIENLSIGTKISIKSLAEELGVSEGTSYHGIKRAELMGLVVTLPKAGTTRVQQKAPEKTDSLTFSSLQELSDAEIVVGTRKKNLSFSRFVVADGSAKDLQKTLKNESSPVLCICGDRPDIEKIAVSCGAHLILTSGASPSAAVISAAKEAGLVILKTKYKTFHVLNIINLDADMYSPSFSSISVEDIAKTPRYLYITDIIADLRELYRKYRISIIPVVDDNRRVCGMIDAAECLDLDFSQHISKLYHAGVPSHVIPETNNITDIIKVFITTQAKTAYMMNDDKQLVGMVHFTDVLKAIRIYGANTGNSSPGLNLAEVPSSSAKDSISFRFDDTEGSRLTTLLADQLINTAFQAWCSRSKENAKIISIDIHIARISQIRNPLTVTLTKLAYTENRLATLDAYIKSDDEVLAKATFVTILNINK